MVSIRPANMKLLSREEFSKQVIGRDECCVICNSQSNLVAHHIVERKLFKDGGYYLDNGATLCDFCHFSAEDTTYPCEHIRKWCGIENIILPPDFEKDQVYTKWGDIVLSNESRIKGPLFYDENVQRILPDHIKARYIDWIKYPRTMHLHFSENLQNDDRMLEDPNCFDGKEIVVTVKMDGENTTFYKNYLHARSVTFKSDATRHWIQSFHAETAWAIPNGWRVCGENMFAKHSIFYKDLPSYFLVFSIWNEKNICLSWDETIEWCRLLGYETVPEIWRGIYEPNNVECCGYDMWDGNEMEGYVVRLAHEFSYKDFGRSVAKFVRKNHVRTTDHWKTQPIVRNELA